MGRLLEEIARITPEREIAVCRELTKRYEETLRGTARTVLDQYRQRRRRGEFTVVIAPYRRGKDA
jgi:16S rRNA (cytidine1402-2'-O)-methyltransferase